MPPNNFIQLPSNPSPSTFLFISYRSWALFVIAFTLLFFAWLFGALGGESTKKEEKKKKKEKVDDEEPRSSGQHKRSASSHHTEEPLLPARPSIPLQHQRQAISSGYDPSKVDDRMSVYIGRFIAENNDDTLISEASIPGVGPSAVERFQSNKIQLVCQLIGKFLSFKSAGISSKDHYNLFWKWLADIGIEHNRSLIVQAIAEKTKSKLPSL
jgi:hypothetical protein